MKKPHVFLLILGVAACIPCGIVSAQEPSSKKSDQVDPLADVLLLSRNLGILSNLAAKLTESNPERAAELLPKWKAQLNAATTVVAVLDGIVGKVTANVDEQKKQIAKLPPRSERCSGNFCPDWKGNSTPRSTGMPCCQTPWSD